MTEKRNIFCEYTSESWTETRRLITNLDNWIYRGQSNSIWNLKTSLDRAIEFSDIDWRAKKEIEELILRKFQRRATNYLTNVPAFNRYLEWFSLIQHHGGPTRLLDFSYSFYVASFFATERTQSDAAIYCLNRPLIDRKGRETEERRNTLIQAEFGSYEYCDKAIEEGIRSPLVMISEPFFMNERLSAQQGLFAIPFEVRQSFEYNLALTILELKELPKPRRIKKTEKDFKCINDDCALLKITLPKDIHKDIKKDLTQMNINAATLFPGLDGFARCLYSEFEKDVTNEQIEFSNYIVSEMTKRQKTNT